MIFFPSYKYMQKVYDEYCKLYENNDIVVQKKNMIEVEYEEFIKKFHINRDIIAFAVIGGAFSEGIDLTNDKLIGVVVIGTGIPQICLERNLIKQFFDNMYNMGFEFAYMYPGFNKVLQASGRVIRTEKDIGTVVLIDSRFMQHRYFKLFPEHWRRFNKVSTINELNNIQKKFWDEKRNMWNDKYNFRGKLKKW